MAVCSFETNALQGFKSRLSVIIHDHLRAQLGPKEQQVGGTVTAPNFYLATSDIGGHHAERL